MELQHLEKKKNVENIAWSYYFSTRGDMCP